MVLHPKRQQTEVGRAHERVPCYVGATLSIVTQGIASGQHEQVQSKFESGSSMKLLWSTEGRDAYAAYE